MKLPTKIIRLIFILLIVGGLGVYTVNFSKVAQAATGINETINFQGKVVNSDGTNVTDGSYSFVFTVYDSLSGGSQLWTETQTLSVVDGIFRASLGSSNPFAANIDWNTDNIYLTTNFNGNGYMTPRLRMTTVPYALNAKKVSGLNVTATNGTLTIPSGATIAYAGAYSTTLTSTGTTTLTLPTSGTLATVGGTETFTSKTIGSSGLIFSGAANDIVTASNEDFVIMPNGSGNVGIGTTNPGALLGVGTSAQFQVSSAGDIVKIKNLAYVWPTSHVSNGFLKNNGSGGLTWETVTGGSGIGGSGTINYVPKFITGGTAVGDSQIFDNGTNVGIGTTAPGLKFTVRGGISMQDPSSAGTASINYAQPYYGRLSYSVTPNNSRSEVKFSSSGATGGTGQTYFVIGASDGASDIGNNLLLGVSSGRAFLTNAYDYNAAGTVHLGGSSWTGDGVVQISGEPSGTGLVSVMGNFGIGITSPGAMLGVGASAQFQVSSSGDIIKIKNLAYVWPTSHVSNGFLKNNGSGGLTWETVTGGSGIGGSGTINYVPKFITGGTSVSNSQIYDDGTNVGIGLTNPGAKFTITSGSAGVSGLRFTNLTSASSSIAGNGKVLGVDSNGSVIYVDDSVGSGSLPSGIFSGQTLRYNGSSWVADGNLFNNSTRVGVGTTVPDATLDVRGAGTTTGITFDTEDSTGATKFAILDNGNVGIGTTAPSEKLHVVGGNILIDAQTPTNTAAEQTWNKINGTSGTIGENNTAIASASAMVSLNGSLYVGTSKTDQAEVYRWNGPTANTWTKISNASAGTFVGGGSSAIDMVKSMTVYNGKLIVGTFESNRAEVYRYDGGTSWTKISNSTAGTMIGGGSTAIDGISAMAVYGGKLYAGTTEGGKAEIYRYDGGTTWVRVSTTTPGTIITTTLVDAITSLVVYNGSLWAAGRKASTADLYRYTGGTVWTRGPTAINSSTEISSMAVWNGKLYLGMQKTGQATVYRYEDSGITGSTNIIGVGNSVGQIMSGGTTAIDGVSAMAVYNGRLYIGTQKANSAEIYRYDGETTWTKMSQASAGQVASGGTTGIDYIAGLVQYENSLVAATHEPSTAEIYTNTVVGDQSYSLIFHSPYSQQGGESNGLANDGEIFFSASPSANVVSNGQTSGNFIFSHGIVTSFGAYDVAEDYPSRDDQLSPGDLVSIDVFERGFVKRTSGVYDSKMVGVYSERPALRLSQLDSQIDGGRVLPVALAGRVPVKVSTENGPIVAGDYLTSSTVPGVAMKAVKSGNVVGRAMENFDQEDVGKILVFVNVSGFIGDEIQVDKISANSLIVDLVTARTIKAGSIEGLDSSVSEALRSKFDNAEIATSAAKAIEQQDWSKVTIDDLVVKLDLSVLKNLTVNGAFKVAGKASFEDEVTFSDKVNFNRDMVGEVVLTKDNDQVYVGFEKEYKNPPVVQVSIATDETNQAEVLTGNLRFVVSQRTGKGFVIKTNKKVDSEVLFTWFALPVTTGNPVNKQVLPLLKEIKQESFEPKEEQIVPTPSALIEKVELATASAVASEAANLLP